MKTYTIHWLDATMQNWGNMCKNSNENTKYFLEDTYTLEDLNCSDCWKDFMAVHTFKAENNDMAISYLADYDFEGRDPDCYSLMHGQTIIKTEEDF